MPPTHCNGTKSISITMVMRLSSQECRFSIAGQFTTQHYCKYTYAKVQGQFLLLLRGKTNAILKVEVHLGNRASLKVLN